MKTIVALLLLVFLLSFFVPVGINPTEAQENSQVTSINLEGTHTIRMPHLSIGTNWTYPYAHIPVLKENQSLKGSVFSDAGSSTKICIKHLSVSELLSNSQTRKNCSDPFLARGQTNESNFTLPGLTSGLYTLSEFDISSPKLSAIQLLVTKENLTLQLPGSILAGEPLIVKANISGLNESKIFGAVMISTEEYDNMSLSLTSNNTGSGYNSTLKLADNVRQLPALSSLSTELAMNLMYLLPSNSAVGMQESSEPEIELFMITDASWPKGEYILTCAVYSKKEGLLDLKQEKVKVV